MELGTYLIGRTITDSALGVVYEATHRESGERVLIQKLPPSRDAQLLVKLQPLVAALGRQAPPGLLPVRQLTTLPDGSVALALEFSRGETLATMWKQRTQLPLDVGLHVGKQLARVLAAAHAQGIAHLMLTPELVLLTVEQTPPAEGVWLFGLGLPTLLGLQSAESRPPESRAYAAPEQLQPGLSVPIDGRADVYALGTLLETLLLGQSAAAPQTMPMELTSLLRRMKAASPTERPSMRDVAAELSQLHGTATQTTPLEAAGTMDKAQAVTVPQLKSPARATPSSDGRIGMLYGNFRIVREIGRGGMGVVYEAEHHKIGKRAAVKILNTKLTRDAEYAQRFLNEARAVNIIRNRGLVEIFEFGIHDDGTLFYVMELLEGESLYHRIEKRQAPFAEPEAIELALQVARALLAAHEKGIIHRDLKPENIMLEADPVQPEKSWAKVLDFGIAKIRRNTTRTLAELEADNTNLDTKNGAFLGTPLYMAPEQHGQAETVDGRADVFSLGVIVYELLVGSKPFKGNALSLLSNTAPPITKLNSTVKKPLAGLVMRMMASKQEDRPKMQEVVQELTLLLPRPMLSRRQRLLLGGGIAAIVVALAIGAALLWTRPPSQGEMREQAQKLLAQYVASSDVEARLMAVRALGQSRDRDQRALLEPLLQQKGLPRPLLEAVVQALGQIGALEARPALLRLAMQKDSPSTVLVAASALQQLQDPRGAELLKQLLEEGDKTSKINAALALLERGDLSGASIIWNGLTHGKVADGQRLKLLGQLALAGDAEAREKLEAEWPKLPPGEARVTAAYNLGRLGDERGFVKLREMAAGNSVEKLSAVRMLAGRGELDGHAELLRLAAAQNEPDSVRELALAGLAASARPDCLEILWRRLDERGASARLRIAAAGAILQITAGERARLGEQSLSWARAALGSDSQEMQELAVSLLGDIESDTAIELLDQAARDPKETIRARAAEELGRKNDKASLRVLARALDDKDASVRSAAMQSIGRIIKALQSRGDREAINLVLEKLRRASKSGGELDRIVASTVLLQVGEGQAAERETMRQGLLSKDARARRLTIELMEPDHDAFVKALSDSDHGVRLKAATRLAVLRSRDGVKVLREASSLTDRDGIEAYRELRKLDENVQPPQGLPELLRSGDVATRLAVLSIVPLLPIEQAQRLLEQALLDPIAVIRRHAADAAAGLYRTTRQRAFLQMLRSLFNDPEVIVRARVVPLIEEFTSRPELPAVKPSGPTVETPQSPPQSPPQTAPQTTPPTKPETKPGPRPPAVENKDPTRGVLVLECDEAVAIQIDKQPWQRASKLTFSLAPGPHRVKYLGGAQDVQIVAGQSVRVRIPVQRNEQLVQDVKDAFERHDLQQAQKRIEDLRRDYARRAPTSGQQAELAYLQGRLHEAQEQLGTAITQYNRALNIPAHQRRASLNAELQSMLNRLSKRAARIQVYSMVGGTCQMTSEILAAPGQQISLGQKGKVFAQAGQTIPMRACP